MATLNQHKGSDYIATLPYDGFRETLDCHHSPLYILRNYEEQPLFCGLCFYREGWESELPTRIHLFKTLAENGNPETSPKFLAHMLLAVGLEPPRPDQAIRDFQKLRSPRARVQYTKPAWGLFPVASSLWKLMGYQPPLAIVLVRGASGRPEHAIATELDLSLTDVHIRMAKAIRTAMGYLPNERSKANDRSKAGRSSDPESEAEAEHGSN